MTVINPNSISGITSITLPSGDGNVLTIHTNDGVERFRIDSSGNVKVGSAATISPDGDLFVTGVTTTGGHFAGSGANLTSLPAAQLTGALPAISGANLTGIAATDNVRTGILDVAGVSSVSFDSASYNYTINTADGGVFTQMIHTRKPGLAAGTHGSEVLVPQITINEYGLVDSIGTTQVAGVSSTSFDSAAGIFTINTADGGVFNTTLIDSDFTRTRVRSSLSASGDLTYDSATGVFSFDVEDVYTLSLIHISEPTRPY